jgi:hypothetical protein
MPISYLLERDGGELVYKFRGDPDNGYYDYSFTPYHKRRPDDPNAMSFTTDCMSTCGMMISREIYDKLGGWPRLLGIYGGGENFINYTLAVLGYSVNIFCHRPLYHYAEKRGYNYEYDDYVRNRILATYIFGGEPVAKKYINHLINIGKGKQSVVEKMLADCIRISGYHRKHIIKNQAYSIEDWYYHYRPCRSLEDNE